MAKESFRFSWNVLSAWLLEMWKRTLRISRRTPKHLRLCESLPLGERRFVAVVEFERERFLLGGTPTSLVLLSRLAESGGQSECKIEEQPEEVAALWVEEAGRLRRRGGRC